MLPTLIFPKSFPTLYKIFNFYRLAGKGPILSYKLPWLSPKNFTTNDEAISTIFLSEISFWIFYNKKNSSPLG